MLTIYIGAKQLLIVFNPKSAIRRCDLLGFYKDVGFTEIIEGFSGKGSRFHPLVIDSNRCWMSFTSSAVSKEKWGYQFYVTPLAMRLSDSSLLAKPTFDFALCMTDWLLTLVPIFVKELYSEEVFNILVAHALNPSPELLNRKIKVIDCITRLLYRWREFPPEGRPDMMLLKPLSIEMYDLYQRDRENGETVHSVILQRLIELMIQSAIVTSEIGKYKIYNLANINIVLITEEVEEVEENTTSAPPLSRTSSALSIPSHSGAPSTGSLSPPNNSIIVPPKQTRTISIRDFKTYYISSLFSY